MSEVTSEFNKKLALFNCCDDEYQFEFCREPKRVGDFVYATDRTILVRINHQKYVHLEEDKSEKPNYELVINKQFDRIFDLTNEQIKTVLSKIPLVHEKPCECCGGRKTVTFEFNYDGCVYETDDDCPICNGKGTVYSETERIDESYKIQIGEGDVFIKSKYIDRLNKIIDVFDLKLKSYSIKDGVFHLFFEDDTRILIVSDIKWDDCKLLKI